MQKANINAFIKTIFLRPVLTFANTLFMFFALFPSFYSSNISFLLFLDSWGVYATLHKILDTLDEKPQRNNLSKLGTLKYEFPQLRHSAMASTLAAKCDTIAGANPLSGKLPGSFM